MQYAHMRFWKIMNELNSEEKARAWIWLAQFDGKEFTCPKCKNESLTDAMTYTHCFLGLWVPAFIQAHNFTGTVRIGIKLSFHNDNPPRSSSKDRPKARLLKPRKRGGCSSEEGQSSINNLSRFHDCSHKIQNDSQVPL